MNIWATYENRISSRGSSKREAALKRELHMLESELGDTLSYHTVDIEGISCNVGIINSDVINEKTIYSLEPNRIKGGEVVEWMNNKWLIVERDANSEIYAKAKLKQCNHLLRWVDNESVIREQWCIVEDGVHTIEGEAESSGFAVTYGDTRITMLIPRNEHTIKFGRNQRFLIDDPEAPTKLAYVLTNPTKVGAVYNNQGVYEFVLQEVVSTDDDNHELGIADYYKHFADNEVADDMVDDKVSDNGKKVWI